MKTIGRNFLLFALWSASAVLCDAATITWTNTVGGSWNEVTNWDPNTVPGAGDTAVIDQPGVTVTLTTTTTVGAILLGGNSGAAVTLSLSGQTLNLDGSLTVKPTGSFTVGSGTLVGNTGDATLIGTIGWSGGFLAGTLTIATNSTLKLAAGGGVVNMPNTTVTNNGTVLWESGTIQTGNNPGTFIYNNGLWDAQSDQTMDDAWGGTGALFNNNGTFRKSGGDSGSGHDTLFAGNIVFNQLAGVLDVQNGTNGLQLTLQGGGSFSGGYITSNQFGLTVLSANNFNINGTVTGTNTWEDAGNLIGANVIQGALTWVGGAWNGAASITIAPESTLIVAGGGGANSMANTLVTNNGTVLWESGTIQGGGNPGTYIYNNGLWDAQSDRIMNDAFGGSIGVVFYNTGTFRKSGGNSGSGGDTLFAGGVLFNQLAGVIDVQNGTNGLQLDFQGSANLTGGYITSNQFGLTVLSQGSFNINGTVIGTNTLENSGNLVGNNVIIGALTWIAGNWDGAASVTITPNSTLIVAGGGGVNNMQNCLVTNNGTVLWESGAIQGGGNPGTYIYNKGLWDAQSDQTMDDAFGGSIGVVFYNTGTFLKSGGGSLPGDHTLIAGGVLFDQLAGVIDVRSGTSGLNLVLQGGANLTGGYITSNQFGLTVLSVGDFNINGTVIGTNTLEDAGNLVGNNVIIGALTWIAGNWDSAASVTITPNSTLIVAGGTGDNDMQNCLVTNNGTVLWQSGTIQAGGNPGTYIYNKGLWDAQSDQDLNDAFGGSIGVVFNNTGTFRKSGGAPAPGDYTRFTGGVLLNQLAGVIDVQSGTNGLNLVLQGGANLSGGYVTSNQLGLTVLSQGSFNINGTVIGTNILEDAGNLVGNNVIIGALTWIAGNWDSAASVTISPNSTLIVAGGAGDNNMQNCIVTNNGTVLWQSGTIQAGGNPGTYIYNNGLWDAQSDQDLSDAFGGSIGVVFNNTGTFRKSGGAPAPGDFTRFTVGVLLNQLAGVIDVQHGTNGLNLVLQGGGNFSGGYITSNQMGLTVLSIGSFNINGTVTGSNTFENAGNLVGNNVIHGALTWIAGNWNSAAVTIANNTTLTVAGGAGLNDMENTIVTNNGTVLWASGTIRGGGNPGTYIYNNGLWNAQSDQILSDTFGGSTGVVFNNAGTFRKSGTSGGSTLFQGNTALDNPGTLDTQVGNISVQGTVTPDHGTMRFGVTSTANYGTVSAALALPIDGTLSLELLGGYAPVLGDTFTLITSGADSAQFEDLNLPALPSGDAWQVNYNAKSVVLTVVALGFANSEITGSVKDAPTHGVADISVFAFTTNNPSIYLSTTTDGNGQYTLNVTNGNWTVGLSNLTANGYIPVPDQMTTTSSGQSTQVVNFLIQAVGSTTPAAVTTAASSVTPSGATLNGTVNPDGEAVTVYFKYGTTTLDHFSASNTLTSSLNSIQPVGIPIAGLSPATLYQFQIVAENSAGTNVGGVLNFTTLGVAPAVVTLPATDIGPTNATVNGSVNPGGLATTYYFEYGTDTNYGTFTLTNPLPAGNSTLLVTNALSNLQPATVYHFQLVGVNAIGTNEGGDLTFTNLPAAPTVQTLAASPVDVSDATLNGSVIPNGLPTAWYFEYGKDTSYGSFTPTNDLPPTNLLLAVSSVLSSLSADTVYHFQLVAANSLGTNGGGDLTFSTQLVPATISCPPDIVTNNAPGECGQTVAFAPSAAGTPTPVVVCTLGGTPITSPFLFPVGTNMVTCTAGNPAGTNSCIFTVTVIDTNPPVAGPNSLGTYQNMTTAVAVAKMLLRDSAPSGGPLSIISVVAATPEKGSVSLGNGLITYMPPVDYFGPDSITYTLSDGCGMAQGTISVTVLATNLASSNQVSIAQTDLGTTVVFAGVPKASYLVQAAPSLTGPWTKLSDPIQAAANGLIQYTDTTMPPPVSRYYRTQYVSGP